MFSANGGIKNVSCFQHFGFLLSIKSIFHFNSPIQHSKNLLPVINVPFVWLVSPVQTCCYAVHVRNI